MTVLLMVVATCFGPVALAASVLLITRARHERELVARGCWRTGPSQTESTSGDPESGLHVRVGNVVGTTSHELVSRGSLAIEFGENVPVRYLPEASGRAPIDMPSELNNKTVASVSMAMVAIERSDRYPLVRERVV